MFLKAMICLILATTGCNYLFQNQQIQIDIAQHQNPAYKELRNNFVRCNNILMAYDQFVDFIPCENEN